jgi:hypothetical protein
MYYCDVDLVACSNTNVGLHEANPNVALHVANPDVEPMNSALFSVELQERHWTNGVKR